jgi:hypothetical protein
MNVETAAGHHILFFGEANTMKHEDTQSEATSQETKAKDKPESPGDKQRVTLQVQTPRGLWSETAPPDAAKRPAYRISTKVSQVIADAREIFKFTEEDNKYVLLHGSTRLEPERTLASYHFADDTLLVLSVQGGNA